MNPDELAATLASLQGNQAGTNAFVTNTFGTGSQAYAQNQASKQGLFSKLFGGAQKGPNDVANPMSSMDKWGMASGALETGMGMYMANEQNKLASDQFDFQKQAYQTNLQNTRTSANMQVDQQYNRDSAWKPQEAGTRADFSQKWGY